MLNRKPWTLLLLLPALMTVLSAQEFPPSGEIDSWDPEAALLRRGFQVGLGRQPNALDLVRLGEALLEDGFPEEERACYEEALRLDPECAPAHGHLALWHYTSGNNYPLVFEATLRFLETSPNREALVRARADFALFGGLRLAPARYRNLTEKARALAGSGKAGEGASLLEEAAQTARPEVAGPWLLFQAGRLRQAAGDLEGALNTFQAALAIPAGPITMEAHLALAALACEAGEHLTALDHLRTALAEGSAASLRIEKDREGPLRSLFESEDPRIREEALVLTDPNTGDAPLQERIEEALLRAEREGKMVLLYWYGPFCPYVMAMEEVLARPGVREALAERFVRVTVDLGSMHRSLTVSEEFGGIMQTLGVPSFHVLHPDGRLHHAQRAGEALMGAPHRCYDEEKVRAFLERAGARE